MKQVPFEIIMTGIIGGGLLGAAIGGSIGALGGATIGAIISYKAYKSPAGERFK